MAKRRCRQHTRDSYTLITLSSYRRTPYYLCPRCGHIKEVEE